MSSLLLLVLAACTGTDPAPPSGDASHDEPTEPTNPQTVDTAGMPMAEEDVSLGKADASSLALQITGVALSCDDEVATVRSEFLGPVGDAELTPWVDGEAGSPVVMEVEPGSLFRKATATGLPCDTTWVITVRAEGQEACMAAGPEAASAAGGACAPR